MDWSCSQAASLVLQAWQTACLASTNTQNTFRVGSDEYFFETSRKEHDDGAITGSVWKMLRKAPTPESPDGTFCKRSSSFRINGDGTIAKAPPYLKNALLVR